MIRLHDYILSSDCYKVRLLLSMLGLAYEACKVNVHPGREQDGAAFRSLSPFGRIPVLQDETLTLSDPQAILVYLALRYDRQRVWLPSDPALQGQVTMWLGFAGRELEGLSALRFAEITSAATTDAARADCLDRGQAALTILEDHLAEGEILDRPWLVGAQATIADLAVFVPVILAPDAGASLDPYPAIWRWLDRVKRLQGFVVMPGVMPNLAGVV